MSEFEKKYGKYAISNLPLILIMCYVVGYIIRYINPAFLDYLTLNPYYIIHGQVWRLISWVVLPPSDTNIFFILIMLFCIYSIAVSLEMVWGTYQYNVYILSGIGFTIIGAFLLMIVGYIQGGSLVAAIYSANLSLYLSTYYINLSILLAYAATFPEARFLLMFIIPIKARWMAIAYVVVLGMQVLLGNMYMRVAVIASLLNFIVFWLRRRNRMGLSPKQMKRKAEFTRHYNGGASQAKAKKITRHKCAICGCTELEKPDMQFRFCSKCEGNYEYCEDHLYTHTHIHMS